ncbi:MAG: hypothetical protein V8S92_02560 [Oscillospiraceae bacterium]
MTGRSRERSEYSVEQICAQLAAQNEEIAARALLEDTDMKQIVCLATSPWYPIPTRKQQVMSRIPDAEILYFDPSASDHRAAAR